MVATQAHATADGLDARTLFEELYDSLHRYVYRLTGDGDAADDVAQEAFVRLLRVAPSMPKAPRPWLFRVATNLVRDRARRSDPAPPPARGALPARDRRWLRGLRARAERDGQGGASCARHVEAT